MKSFDDTVSMSQPFLDGLTWDQAGTSVLEKNMVLTSTKNNLDAKEIEKALLV